MCAENMPEVLSDRACSWVIVERCERVVVVAGEPEVG